MATKQIKFKSFGEMIYYIFRKKHVLFVEVY